MRIVFLGTPSTAVVALEVLAAAGHEIALVVTQPDRPVGRSRRPSYPPVKQFAVERDWPVFQPVRVRNRSFRQRLAEVGPDLLAVVAYGRILSRPTLDLAPLGAINLHFSLLPAYRGAAPVQWALARGESETGVTTMVMNERMDEGDLLLQRKVPIAAGEHAPALQRRLAEVGSRLLCETVAGLGAGTIERRPQDPARATVAPLLARADGEIDPGLPAREIEGRVRGFDPWPGVWVSRQGRRLRLVEARAVDRDPDDRPPGTLVGRSESGVLMTCGQGTLLELTRLQPEGRKPVSAADALNGRQIALGERLEAWKPGETAS